MVKKTGKIYQRAIKMNKKLVVGILIVICGVFVIYGLHQTFPHQERDETVEDYLWSEVGILKEYMQIGFSISPFISNVVGIEENDCIEETLEKIQPLADNYGLACRYFAPILFSELIRRDYVCSLEMGVFMPKYDPDNPSATYIVWIHDKGFYETNHLWVRLENGDVLDFWEDGRWYVYVRIYDIEWENERWWSFSRETYPNNLVWDVT